jgi:ABC-2 type transport system permease protein
VNRELKPIQAVLLVAGRELNTRLRTRAFVISTIVSIVVLAGFLFLQGGSFGQARIQVGLSGQATALGKQIVEATQALGRDVAISDVNDQASGDQRVRDGDLDAFVSGPIGALEVKVKDNLAPELQSVLNGLMQQQVLTSQLAANDLPAKEILATVDQTHITLTRLDPQSEDDGQRLAIGLVVAFLLYMALMIYGQTVAQGVIEEKSSRVVEILLATVRPWQLLGGKVLGLGLVGLIQFAAIAAVGGVLAGLLWYLLGFFFYATIFAAVGSLVSRQEDAQGVLTPVTMVIVVGFIFSINLLVSNDSGTLTTVMAMLPPFAPILMPGLIALGIAPIWLQAAAIILTLGGIALVSWIGGRIYRNAVLRTGSRVRLKDAFKAA